jgi:hypothetical protein
VLGACACQKGWVGDDCATDLREHSTHVSSCPNQCSGEGACVRGVCACLPGRFGADCGTGARTLAHAPPTPTPEPGSGASVRRVRGLTSETTWPAQQQQQQQQAGAGQAAVERAAQVWATTLATTARGV